MKATYRHDNLSARRKFLMLALTVVLGVLVLSYGPVRGAISRAVYGIAPEVWTWGGTFQNSWHAFWGEFRLKRSLVSENEALQEEVARMQAQVLDRNLLEEKVTALEESLGRTGSDNRIVAHVLAGPGRSPYDTLVIDAGTEQGIALADRVVYAGAGVIGEIIEVYSSSAKVKLFSSPGENTPILIGAQAIPVVAHGRGMGNFEADVPRGSLVIEGDKAMVPGESLILGIVGAIEETPAEPFTRVFLRTSFNIATIRSVEVIKKER